MRCAIVETFPEPNRRLLQRSSLSLSLSLCHLPLSSSLIDDMSLPFSPFAYCHPST